MTQDEIKDMAREADVRPMLYDGLLAVTNLDKFAALVAAAEREACAKVCDDMSNSDWSTKQCAEFIRARGQA